MDTIGNISSVITLVLFITYILGRCWSTHINAKCVYEKIEIEKTTDTNEKDIIIVNGSDILELQSEEYLNWVKVYSAKLDGEKVIADKKTLKIVRSINRKTPIYLGVNISEGIPNTVIEYQRADYVQGTFVVKYDGKGTGYSADDYTIKNTFLTWLYYLLK